MPKAPACVAYGVGRPIVLVHGFPFHSGMWSGQIAPLRALGKVILVDLLGFGANALGGATPMKLTMDEQADAVAAALDHLKVREPATFVGFSMGGYVGWSFLRRHRQRVDSLVMCNTRALADTPEAARARLDMADIVEGRSHAFVIDTLLPKLVAPRTLDSRPDVCAQITDLIEEAPLAAIAAAQRGMAERPDSTQLAGELGMPTLAIVGEHDVISKRDELEALTTRMRDATLAVIPDAGHMTVFENVEATNRALCDFIGELR